MNPADPALAPDPRHVVDAIIDLAYRLEGELEMTSQPTMVSGTLRVSRGTRRIVEQDLPPHARRPAHGVPERDRHAAGKGLQAVRGEVELAEDMVKIRYGILEGVAPLGGRAASHAAGLLPRTFGGRADSFRLENPRRCRGCQARTQAARDRGHRR